MKKILQLSLILTIVLAFFMSFSVFAVEADNTASNENSATSENTTDENTQLTTSSNASTTKSSAAQVTTLNPDEKKDIERSDILNILLIATGVVIILLAVAIFIKIK
ncbi:MAG: hypothetical protein IJ690_04020 [Clostridia bacterium]|nr:hypothetical protein [Clostridia bacterium]